MRSVQELLTRPVDTRPDSTVAFLRVMAPSQRETLGTILYVDWLIL